jgi:PPOX class probable F420-dependent enzyme
MPADKEKTLDWPVGNSVETDMLSDRVSRFLAVQRIAHLATADRSAIPHVVPVCFALLGHALYITIDEKPKRGATLKRLRNIAENPAVAIVVDRYEEDWGRLGWVMLHGRAHILAQGAEHDEAQDLLRARYPQLAAMQIAGHPVIAMRIERVISWGNLCATGETKAAGGAGSKPS